MKVVFFVLLVGCALGAPANAQTSPPAMTTSNPTTTAVPSEPTTAVFYMKQISKPEGLAVYGTLNLVGAVTGIGMVALLGPIVARNAAAASQAPSGALKTSVHHLADNALAVLGLAMGTGLSVSCFTASIQSYFSALQNWYVTPGNIKNVGVSDL